uniref:Unconventional myosin-Ia n=1 Tax=Junco hyemalis TaxID=40217 RepID=A0A8C5ICL7_JUNHY
HKDHLPEDQYHQDHPHRVQPHKDHPKDHPHRVQPHKDHPKDHPHQVQPHKDHPHHAWSSPSSAPRPDTSPSPDLCVHPQDAMRIIGFSPTEVTELLQVTAVVLKLGNVQLSSSFQASGMEACSISEPQELHEICELIGLEPGTLERALCSRTVKARDETVLTTLTVPQVSRSTPSCGASIKNDQLFSFFSEASQQKKSWRRDFSENTTMAKRPPGDDSGTPKPPTVLCRCIKPNDTKSAMVFTPELVLAQVRYLGLLENVRVRRAGYAFRQLYGPFLQRYKMLNAQTWPRWDRGDREGTEVLLAGLEFPDEELAFGHTKIFIRSPRTLFDLERRRQERVAELATLIQKMFRGWRCRTQYQLMRKSQILISAWFRGHRQKNQYKQMKRSALILQAYARGWKARKTYRKYFRSSASTCLANFIYRRLVQKYLVGLAKNLPPLSVTDRTWPPAPYRFLDGTNQELKNIFYHWKCKKYRDQLSASRRAQLQARLCASELFKDKKTLYPKSLQQPFRGEYLGLKQNPKYQKLHAVAKDKLVMADSVRKVNRASGKTVPRLLLLTTEHLVLADPKAAQPKTVLSLSDIRGVSVTRFSDGFLALHLKEVSTVGAKGDFLLVSDHLIELVTRLYQTFEATTGQALPLHITDRFSTRFPKGDVSITVVESPKASTNGPVCKKKGSNKMEVLVY